VPLIPDDSRMWYSVGATNTVGNFKIDLAYSFIDVKNAPINVVPGNPSFNGLVTYTVPGWLRNHARAVSANERRRGSAGTNSRTRPATKWRTENSNGDSPQRVDFYQPW
jgi:hypothetical protein